MSPGIRSRHRRWPCGIGCSCGWGVGGHVSVLVILRVVVALVFSGVVVGPGAVASVRARGVAAGGRRRVIPVSLGRTLRVR